MNSSVYNLLLRSFDSPLTEKERKVVDAALAVSEEFRSAERELSILRSTLRSNEERRFNSFFVERVLQRLRNPEPSVDEYFFSVFRRLAAGAVLVVILLSAYNVSESNAFSVESALGIHHTSLEQVLTLEVPFE